MQLLSASPGSGDAGRTVMGRLRFSIFDCNKTSAFFSRSAQYDVDFTPSVSRERGLFTWEMKEALHRVATENNGSRGEKWVSSKGRYRREQIRDRCRRHSNASPWSGPIRKKKEKRQTCDLSSRSHGRAVTAPWRMCHRDNKCTLHLGPCARPNLKAKCLFCLLSGGHSVVYGVCRVRWRKDERVRDGQRAPSRGHIASLQLQ